MRKSKPSPDPPKHVRHCRRFPLAAPRRPNAATIDRGGDPPKRVRPGSFANGRRNAVGEGVGPAEWFALAIVWVAVCPQCLTVGGQGCARRRGFSVVHWTLHTVPPNLAQAIGNARPGTWAIGSQVDKPSFQKLSLE
jgi:hypothetical protein